MKFITGLLMLLPAISVAADPKYGPLAVPLAEDNAYFRQAPAPDF